MLEKKLIFTKVFLNKTKKNRNPNILIFQISDYKHHWSDVLVGAIMGTLIGNFVALFVAEVFKRREIPPCELEPSYGLIR